MSNSTELDSTSRTSRTISRAYLLVLAGSAVLTLAGAAVISGNFLIASSTSPFVVWLVAVGIGVAVHAAGNVMLWFMRRRDRAGRQVERAASRRDCTDRQQVEHVERVVLRAADNERRDALWRRFLTSVQDELAKPVGEVDHARVAFAARRFVAEDRQIEHGVVFPSSTPKDDTGPS